MLDLSATSFVRDYLGPISHILPPNVTAHSTIPSHHPNVVLLTLSATADISLTQTVYHDPQVYFHFSPASASLAHNLHFLGFQASEFALPVRAPDVSLNFNLFSRPGYSRPPSVFPLFIFHRKSSAVILLAPLDNFHEQVLAIHDNTFHCGWSGDLIQIPKHFSTTLAIIHTQSPTLALSTWTKLLRTRSTRHISNTPSRYRNVLMSKLSYWTDNGSAYWYRRESGQSLTHSIINTVNNLEENGVHIGVVELDSWFYPHEINRPVSDLGYLSEVPPSGLLLWEPRMDTLGKAGVCGLRNALNGRPLVLHSRHISAASPYVSDRTLGAWWVDGERAHPVGCALWRRLLRQAADWGAMAFEQDWLVELWQGVRALREKPGRVVRWQKDVDDAAEENGLCLIWCMATPADMLVAATTLSNVLVVRSCDDYRYADDASTLWRWHLTVSSVVRHLGMVPFKDVFLSKDHGRAVVDVDGDPNAEVEACLATMSAGPVGIGDRLDRTDVRLVRRCCRMDGTLVKPDVPMVALDRSLRNADGLLWGMTHSGKWRYLFAVGTGVKYSGGEENVYERLEESVCLHDMDERKEEEEEEENGLGDEKETEMFVYNWGTRSGEIGNVIRTTLGLHEWELWVVCPVVRTREDAFALIGDGEMFATMGDRRVRVVDGEKDEVLFEVLGQSGEEVTMWFWSERRGVESKTVKIRCKGWIRCRLGLDSSDTTLGVCMEQD